MLFTDPDMLKTDMISVLIFALPLIPVFLYVKRRKGLWIVGRLLLVLTGMLVAFVALAPFVLEWALVTLWVVAWMYLDFFGGFLLKGVKLSPRSAPARPKDTATEIEVGLSPPDGAQGVALTALRPCGQAEIGGQRHEVIADHGYIERGDRIRVVGRSMGCLRVTKADS